MLVPQSLRSRLAGRVGLMAQPFAGHERSTGLFVSGLGPREAPPCGPAEPDPWALLDDGVAALAVLERCDD